MRPLLLLSTLGLLTACSAAPPMPVATGPSPKPIATDPRPTPEAPLVPVIPAVPASGLQTSAPDRFPAFAAVSDETRAKLVASQNRAAADLYTRLADDDANLVFSPTSISFAFGMVYAGARGDTAEQMASVFRYDLPQEEIHAAYGTVLRNLDLGENSKVELSVANRLFGEKTRDFRPGFVDVTADHYRAELDLVDFRHAHEAARKHINGWIADETQKRIQDLIPENVLNEATALVLANAVYFKGDWKTAFDPKVTKKDDFTTPKRTVQTDMMHMRAHHRFAEHDGALMLEMAYQGDELVMQLVLPVADDGLPALEKRLGSGLLDQLSSKLGRHEVIVTMPRFTIDGSALSLKGTLQRMGVVDAFDEAKADLTAMAVLRADENLYIKEAFHKAFIEVKEEGTEAAAATAIVTATITSAAPPPPPPKVFDADHPFLFVIRDRKSNSILFLGRINDPTA